jgi:class 3 adenylate cyclase
MLAPCSSSTAIVSSLFPETVRDRLYPTTSEDNGEPRGKLLAMLDNKAGRPMEENISMSGSPIAELYPDTTVLFADIAGFTAWSSVRTPAQVFYLLETLFGAFDAIASKRGVFKVETIGDCYVAVVGLPVPRKHHAVVMARFAWDIRNKMLDLIDGLSTTLGPVSGTSP